ncbi:FAD-binding protein [Limnoglobus roseus]|uniref:Aclacinomycin-N/aclacinomycin-A oxidase n=1 Tax=Limnoglobus roseus TaxID=2598579 RepID=A0A5C1APN3_9BACT|nr:FAD-binding protein [Limnoglobus roseus]QEL19184.1 Aclacinomycin-N/aclacinomycin-A oxidase [Limnoglobus roseus]
MAKKKPEFQGSIVHSAVDALTTAFGVKGAHQVWFPKTKADVATAVALSKEQVTLIRSGMQAAATDTAEAVGGIVIHLAGLTKITAKPDAVNAEAGATTSAVAEQLEVNDLALPLIDSPLKSIVSNVLDDTPSCLIRSLGPLSDYVTKLTGVTPDGQSITRSGATALARVLEEKAVITGVTFEPAPAKGLWMVRRSFLYPGKDRMTALVKALFLDTEIPSQCDVILEALSARHDFPVVSVMAAGAGLKGKKAVTELVEGAIATLPAGLVSEDATENFTGASVIRAIVDAGADLPIDPEVDAHRIRRVVEPQEDLNQFLDLVVDDLDRGLAFREDGTGKRDENMRVFSRLQLDREDRVSLSGLVFTPRPATSSLLAPLASVSFLQRAETPFHVGLDFPPLFAPRIPGFKGVVYVPTDLLYRLHADQYATSSHKREDMSPFMVAYPRDVDDIKSAITFAQGKQKSLVARSGGHQYSGLSSGGSGTIVLAMDRFDQITRISDNVFDVGPAVPLTRLARFFKGQGVTIPHGECPLVCIGGHAQTGGFGHLLRSFGLTLDYVTELTIVLSDGSVRTVQRPAGAPTTDDEKLFWGVLGGNAGSFGIVTNYRFKCIKDSDHPKSFGYSAKRLYRKGRYKNLMKQAQAWTQGIVAGSLPRGIDFMMTVLSKADTFRPPVPGILVELVHANLGGEGEAVDPEEAFAAIMDAADSDPPPLDVRLTDKRSRFLSDLSDSFVRRFPLSTPNGREFRQPYNKRLNATMDALTDDFIDGLVDLVDTATATKGLYLVFQMAFGGGSFRDSQRRPETSIPRRDIVYCFVFDLFYDEEMKPEAERLQGEMQTLIDQHFSPGQERRLLWGSFGDTDITKDAVRDFYYDDLAVYDRLRELKKKVDPVDLFHTSLTVKLP